MASASCVTWARFKSHILLLTVPLHRDVCLTGRTECVEDLLAMLGIIERCAIDRRHQIAGPQSEAQERLPVAARINPVAGLFTVRIHRLRPHHVRHQAGLFGDELAHAVATGLSMFSAAAEGGGATGGDLSREHQFLQAAPAVDHYVVAVDGLELGAAGQVVSDRKHFGTLRALPEDGEPIFRIITRP